jgi:hypothetical protein
VTTDEGGQYDGNMSKFQETDLCVCVSAREYVSIPLMKASLMEMFCPPSSDRRSSAEVQMIKKRG